MATRNLESLDVFIFTVSGFRDELLKPVHHILVYVVGLPEERDHLLSEPDVERFCLLSLPQKKNEVGLKRNIH